MPFLTTPDGRSLFYDRRGAGAPLLCHPGGPGLSGSLFGDLGGLAGFRNLIVLEPRGTGRSEQPRSAAAYALEDYVSDLRHLQEHLGLERIDLLGHSHGSFVALLYAARYPEMIGRLVLVATGLQFSEADLERMQIAAQERSGEPWFEDASAALREEEEGEFDDAELGRILARTLPFYFAHYGPQEQAFARLAFERPVHAAAKRYFDAHEFLTFNLRPQLSLITAPTLVVAGEEDFILPPSACREVAEGIANARLVVVDDVGHFPWVERPEEFTRLLSAFLG